MNRSTESGFSLIELMVVVAIIGLLAAIGIPQYSRFQSKARTVEARSVLAAVFIAEKSYAVEWDGYSVDLKAVGLSGTGGMLRYVTGFAASVPCSSFSANHPPEDPNNSQSVAAGVFDGSANWHPTIATAGTLSAALTGSACSTTAFLAVSIGDPHSTPNALVAGVSDTWTINETKTLLNPVLNF